MIKGSTKVKIEAVVKALENQEGMVYLAAKDLGISAKSIYGYRDKYPEVATAIEENRGQHIDKAENELKKAIERGEGWAICFTLKTLGRSRGYVEKHEIEHSGAIDVSKLSDQELIERAKGIFGGNPPAGD
jgi:hypothetical protein